jgi:UDP-MurNAc hydroxylase
MRDHWHGLTLKKLRRGKPVLVPDEPGLRSGRDLQRMGFDDVRRIPHGKTVNMGDIRITFYPFGLYINDSAIVLEADGVCLLNANDCKIAGAPLAEILRRHPRIDFAFRSHSSANPRGCFRLLPSNEPLERDEDDQYFESFCAFMDVVRPRFAVPFASNNCHVHPDSREFNGAIANPKKLETFVQSRPRTWDFALMLPGSMWSSDGGLRLTDASCFEDPLAAIDQLVGTMADSLAQTAAAENAILLETRHWQRFASLVAHAERRRHLAGDYLFTVRWPDGRLSTRRLALPSLQISEVPATDQPAAGLPLAVIPVAVFRDAVNKNMFHHACVSKRCRFYGLNSADLWRLRGLMVLLEFVELDRFPLRAWYAWRMATAYVRRWRELLVYAQAFWWTRIKGLPVYRLEMAILGSMRRGRGDEGIQPTQPRP